MTGTKGGDADRDERVGLAHSEADVTQGSGPIWKPVLDWPYEVNEKGHIRRVGGSLIAQRLTRRGYNKATLSVRGERKTVETHRIVALAFHGPGPEGYFVHHKDGNKTNNRPENLEYVTREENERHATENGLKAKGEAHGSAKLTEADIYAIREDRRDVVVVAQEYGVAASTIHDVKARKTWRHLPDRRPAVTEDERLVEWFENFVSELRRNEYLEPPDFEWIDRILARLRSTPEGEPVGWELWREQSNWTGSRTEHLRDGVTGAKHEAIAWERRSEHEGARYYTVPLYAAPPQRSEPDERD